MFLKEITQSSYKIGVCQYQLIENSKISLQSSEINIIDREIVCDCRTNIILSIPLKLHKQISLFDTDNALVEGVLDYSYYSRRLVPFKD